MFVMHIITLFYPISLNFQKQLWQKCKDGQEGEGDVMVEVEVDEKWYMISGVFALL